MTLRDLTEAQRDELVQLCEEHILERNKARREYNLLSLDYKIGYSDGARDILKRLDYLPDAKS